MSSNEEQVSYLKEATKNVKTAAFHMKRAMVSRTRLVLVAASCNFPWKSEIIALTHTVNFKGDE